MSAALKLMDADEFLVWSDGREGVWELVDGVPRLKRIGVPAELMSGTNVRHDRVRRNIEFALVARLRGGPCEVFSEAIATRVASGRMRRPDITVDCGEPRPDANETAAPKVLFEILSASTRKTDMHEKPSEYQQLPTLQHFVIIEQSVAACTLWSREPDGSWRSQAIIGLQSAIDLTALGMRLSLAEVFEGVDLDERD